MAFQRPGDGPHAFQALGADVNWIQSTQTVVGTRGSRIIRLTVGQAVGYVNGRPVRLDAPAQVIGGRVFVPLRFSLQPDGLPGTGGG